MKLLFRLVRRSAFISLATLATVAPAWAVSVTTLARLGGTVDGYHPASALIAGSDGAFYGTTEAGGPANCGTVYRVAADGTFGTLYTFSGSDGANPNAALVAGGDGFLYGTTSTGGTNGNGTIFKISQAGAFTSLYSFSGLDNLFHNADGAAPQAALVSGGDGYLYGTAASGGTVADGTIFRITLAGVFNTVYSFSKYSDGILPQAALTPGGDGYLYGTTSGGGTISGTIFRVSPAGAYQVLYNFTNGTDGGNSKSALVLSGGQFYGLSNKAFFAVTTAGAFTTLHTFTSTEGNPVYGGLIAAPGGNFYGTAAEGGAENEGSVFQMTPAGAVTVLYSFQNNADGASPATPPLLGSDGNLYGVNSNGFNGNFASGGIVYQLNPAGTLTTLHAFTAGGSQSMAALVQDATGNFYGVTGAGGANAAGTAFALNASGTLLGVYDCNPDTDGRQPNSALVAGGDGSFYSTTSGDGPDGAGTLFQLTVSIQGGQTGQASARFTRVHGDERPRYQGPGIGDAAFGWLVLNLPPDDGSVAKPVQPRGVTLSRIAANAPQARALSSAGPVLYSVFQAGGDGNGGAIYSFPGSGTPVLLHSFGVASGDGLLPEGLIAGPDGNFYGTTYGGGTATEGTVFKYGADGTYAVLYSFQGTGDGSYPQTGLTAGSDGNLYGVTQHAAYNSSAGFTGAPGTIFSITPGGTFKTLHTFATNGSEGSQPMAALFQASDGNLYGTTQDGVLFSITTGGQFTVLYRYVYGSGGTSLYGTAAPLIQGSDGNLYGTTSGGGTDGAGVVYKVALGTVTTPPTVPVATLTATMPKVINDGSGDIGEFTLSLTPAPTADTVVNFTIKGTGINGTDYALLKATKKIKAGKASKPIKVTPEGDLEGADKKTVVLTLQPGTGYTVGTTDKVKVKIFAPTN